MSERIEVLVGVAIVLLAAACLIVYHIYETVRIDRQYSYISDWDRRKRVIDKVWQERHPLMPYAGQDVGIFIGFCGIVVPAVIYAFVLFAI